MDQTMNEMHCLWWWRTILMTWCQLTTQRYFNSLFLDVRSYLRMNGQKDKYSPCTRGKQNRKDQLLGCNICKKIENLVAVF